jgi:hypothetical protein
MNLRTEISLLGILTTETVLLIVYSSQPQRAFTSKSYLHSYRPLRFPRCSHVQQKVLLSSFSASDNVLVTYVLTVKRRVGCQIFSTLRSGGPLADGRQVGLDRAPDPGSGRCALRAGCCCWLLPLPAAARVTAQATEDWGWREARMRSEEKGKRRDNARDASTLLVTECLQKHSEWLLELRSALSVRTLSLYHWYYYTSFLIR